jgi:hypothetical protein
VTALAADDVVLWPVPKPADWSQAIYLVVDGGKEAALACAKFHDVEVEYVETSVKKDQTVLRAKMAQYGLIRKWWVAGTLRRTISLAR